MVHPLRSRILRIRHSMARRDPLEIPVLVFAGTEVTLVWILPGADDEMDRRRALVEWRCMWEEQHANRRFTLADDEVRVRRLRPDDERWVSSSISPFRQLSGGDKKILDALKHVREKVSA